MKIDVSKCFTAIDCIVDCAGATHLVGDVGTSVFDACRAAVNVGGTRNLADKLQHPVWNASFISAPSRSTVRAQMDCRGLRLLQ